MVGIHPYVLAAFDISAALRNVLASSSVSSISKVVESSQPLSVIVHRRRTKRVELTSTALSVDRMVSGISFTLGFLAVAVAHPPR